MKFLPPIKQSLSSCSLRLKFEGLFFAETSEVLHKNKINTQNKEVFYVKVWKDKLEFEYEKNIKPIK